MPKNKAQRRIDKTAGSGARTISIVGGGSGGGDSASIGQHSLSGNLHTGKLAEAQAPWAVTETEFSAHTTNANAHHNRRHSITSTSDHSVTADAYALLGATNTDTLGLLYIASSGDGIDVTKSSSTFTIGVDVSDFGGAGLVDDGSNNLDVDFAYDFDWTGQHTFADTISSLGANPATDPITGWRLDANGTGYFNDLRATSLNIKAFVSDVTLALQGSEIVTKSKAIVSRDFTTPTTTGTLYVYDLPGSPNAAVFENSDYVRLRYVEVSTGLVVGDVYGTVSGYTDLDDGEQSWTFTRTTGTASKTIYAGMVAIDYGQSGDGVIELTSLGDDTPVITLNTWASTPTNQTTRVALGNLARVTDGDYGTLSGYGLFTDNVKLKGSLAAGGSSVVVGDDGINIDGGVPSAGDINTIQWKADPFDASSVTIAGMYGINYELPPGTVNSEMVLFSGWGGSTGTDTSTVEMRADESVGSGAVARMTVSGQTVPEATLWLEDDSNGRGEFIVKADTTTHGHIVPAANNSVDLGDGSHYFRAIYVDTIYAGTTSSTDTGHNHNDLYNTKAEIVSLLSGKSNTDHSHAGLVTSAGLTTTLADYVTSASLTTTLAGYYTEAQADLLYDAKADLVHTHNDLYFTEAESDARFAAIVHSHDDRYNTKAEITALLAAGVTASSHDVVSTHTVTAAQYAVLSTWGAANTLSMVTATDDGTAGHKLLKTDANGDLTLNDLTFADATISGVISSDDYVAGSAGFYIDSDRAEFGALRARGAFQSAVFEVDSTAVFSSRQLIVKSSGTLRNSIAINTSGGVEHQLDIEFPTFGEHPIAVEGDVLRIRGLASYTAPTSSGNSTTPVWEFWAPQVLATGVAPANVWLTVTGINKAATHYTYTCDWESGSDNVTLLAGEAVAVYGQSGDGVIESVATGGGAPYINIATHSGSPWIDAVDHVRIGQLGGITPIAAAANEWGIAAGTLTSSSGAYIVISDQQAVLHSVPFLMTDSAGGTTGSWNENGIALVAPRSSAYQLPGDEAIGGGAPDEDWYAPAYSSINWSTDPDSTSESDEYGALRLMTQRTYTGGFGASGYDSITRLEMRTRGQRLIAEDNLVTESAIAVDTDDGLASEFVLRSYQYENSNSTEATLTAGRFNVSANTFLNSTVTINGGVLKLNNFPTSEADVAIGQVYIDSGTLKVKTA